MIEVLRAGLCDVVMDRGRPGWGALGVPAGGAADPAALAAANQLAGNDPAAGGLEITLRGPTLRFPEGGVVALTGAGFAARRSSGAPVVWNETVVLAAGETLTLDGVRGGCRCWFALRGGLAVPPVMASRSTFLPGGFGGFQGRALRAGDVLPTGDPGNGMRLLRAHPPPWDMQHALRVVAGPQAGQFDDRGLLAFFGASYRVAASSDRRGLRLEGTPLRPKRRELGSQGVLPGAIQVPPNGQPILLGWDGPVTGGYPVIAAVIAADLPKVAQLKPGAAVRFVTVEVERARALAAASWRIEDIG